MGAFGRLSQHQRQEAGPGDQVQDLAVRQSAHNDRKGNPPKAGKQLQELLIGEETRDQGSAGHRERAHRRVQDARRPLHGLDSAQDLQEDLRESERQFRNVRLPQQHRKRKENPDRAPAHTPQLHRLPDRELHLLPLQAQAPLHRFGRSADERLLDSLLDQEFGRLLLQTNQVLKVPALPGHLQRVCPATPHQWKQHGVLHRRVPLANRKNPTCSALDFGDPARNCGGRDGE